MTMTTRSLPRRHRSQILRTLPHSRVPLALPLPLLLFALPLPLLALLSAPVAAQEAIYVVRHAEQVPTGDDPPLSDAGQRRARALTAFLRDAGVTAIYTSERLRAIETARPLADALGIGIREVGREEIDTLVARIRREEPTGRVLVVGHSDTVPRILRALGHPGEITIEHREYDNLFVVIPGAEEPVVLRHRLSAW